MDRRQFLAMGGLAIAASQGASARATSTSSAAAAAVASSQKMLMRRIPSSGEMLPAIGIGTSGPFEVGASEAER